MGMPVKLSDELVESARGEAATAERSITGQIEHWARIGRSVEAVLRHHEIKELKRSPDKVTLPAATQRAVRAALKRVIASTGRESLAKTLKAGRTVYQSDPSGSALIERIEPDGTRTLGQLINRRFVPAEPVKSSRRR